MRGKKCTNLNSNFKYFVTIFVNPLFNQMMALDEKSNAIIWLNLSNFNLPNSLVYDIPFNCTLCLVPITNYRDVKHNLLNLSLKHRCEKLQPERTDVCLSILQTCNNSTKDNSHIL